MRIVVEDSLEVMPHAAQELKDAAEGLNVAAAQSVAKRLHFPSGPI